MSKRRARAVELRQADKDKARAKRMRGAEGRMERYYARKARAAVITLVALVVVGGVLAVWWFYLGGDLVLSP